MKKGLKDILNAANYNFSTDIGNIKTGDSGDLLIATHKTYLNEKYLVKHYCVDCACNEYVASKLGQAVQANYPECKLFDVSEQPPTCFRTDYAVGIEWLEDMHDYDPGTDAAENADDFYKFLCLQQLFAEYDGFEVAYSRGKIYKIDNASGFALTQNFFSPVKIEVMSILKDIPKHIYDDLGYKDLEYEARRQFFAFGKHDVKSIQRQISYGLKCANEDTNLNHEKIYKQTLFRFMMISQDYIEDMIDNLAVVYPEYICEHYRECIDNMKEACEIVWSEF